MQIVVDTALQQDDSIIMDQVDNGYVDSHTDTYYSDWGGSDYDDDTDSFSCVSRGKQSGGGCSVEFINGFIKSIIGVIVIYVIFAILMAVFH